MLKKDYLEYLKTKKVFKIRPMLVEVKELYAIKGGFSEAKQTPRQKPTLCEVTWYNNGEFEIKKNPYAKPAGFGGLRSNSIPFNPNVPKIRNGDMEDDNR